MYIAYYTLYYRLAWINVYCVYTLYYPLVWIIVIRCIMNSLCRFAFFPLAVKIEVKVVEIHVSTDNTRNDTKERKERISIWIWRTKALLSFFLFSFSAAKLRPCVMRTRFKICVLLDFLFRYFKQRKIYFRVENSIKF